jgi:hypothetical protein
VCWKLNCLLVRFSVVRKFLFFYWSHPLQFGEPSLCLQLLQRFFVPAVVLSIWCLENDLKKKSLNFWEIFFSLYSVLFPGVQLGLHNFLLLKLWFDFGTQNMFTFTDAGAVWLLNVLVTRLCLVHLDLWTDASGCDWTSILGRGESLAFLTLQCNKIVLESNISLNVGSCLWVGSLPYLHTRKYPQEVITL